MSNLSKYAQCSVYVNGKLLAEEASVTINRDTKANQVFTVNKGFAGVSPGSPMIEIDVESAIRNDDFELNVGKFMTDLEVVDFVIYCASRTLSTKGFVVNDSTSHAVNSEAKVRFKAECQYADWI